VDVPRPIHIHSLAALIATLLCLCAARAAAQDVAPPPPETHPIGRFVVDARAAFPKFKQNPVTATAIGVTTANLPTRTIGLVAGAHWYPKRLGVMTLGLGGELMMAHASRTQDPATKDAEPGPTAKTRFSALSPQVSFNFGAREGWSYISGGIGWSSFTVEREDRPFPDAESRIKTINYGGGARWFSKRHVGVSLDLRFYAVNPQLATSTRPAYPRMTLMVMNGGVAFK
jgi:hypothetical protein